MTRISFLTAGFLLIALSAWGADRRAGAASITIKIATIAPEGSTWMDVSHEYENYVKEHTNGAVKFTMYAGGVMGDEPEVIRKIKLGQLQAGGFSGMGLGKVVPEVRVLELPLLFKTYDEVDYVLGKLDKTLRKLFDDKGFVLLGWAEQGFIYVFTNKPVYQLDDLSGVKMFVWAGDNFAKIIFDSLEVLTPIPVAVPEVLSSLQTGLINAFYNTPLGAVALQWYPHVKYMINIPFTYGTGAIILDKKAFQTYPPEVRTALLEGGRIIFPKLMAAARRDNAQFLKDLPREGVTFINPDPGIEPEMKKKMDVAYKKLTGVFFPDWLLSAVKETVYEYRAHHEDRAPTASSPSPSAPEQ